jgi:signal transduction histidine kinase
MDLSVHRARTFVPQRVVQLGWLLVAGICVSLLLAGIVPYMRLVTVACQGPDCLAAQRTAEELLAMQRAGVPVVPEDGLQLTAMALFPVAIALLTAAYCIWRRPADPAAVAGAWGLTTLGTAEFVRALAQQTTALHLVADLIQLAAALGLAVCLCHIPEGRLRAPWIGWALGGLTLAGALAFIFDIRSVLAAAWGMGLFSVCVSSLAIQHRATVGSPRHERVTWAIVALALLVGAQLIGRPLRLLPLSGPLPATLPPEAFALFATNGMVLVVGALACLAVALLRDELFDVELVLNRALVYGLLSIVVVACYILIVGYLSLLFQGSGNLWVSLVATGVVAALFQPLRARVQRLVNQLLYGQRAEPYAVVAELGRRLATSLAPDAVLPAIVETVAGALRLPYAAIALRQGDDEVTAAAYGEAPPGISLATFPLIYQGAEVGQLRVAPRAGESELSADDRRLLEDLAHQAGVAAHAVQLTNDLRRSREQLVSAREEERRRLRRDLHDGLGPALASQALTVDTVELLLSRDPAAAAALLREVKAQSQAAITEIRRVIYGLRPPALDDLGLVGALREQANRLVLSRAEIRIEAPEPLLPLPAAVEVAAYHIAQEALANVARHASARHCTVVLAVSDVLTLTVTDDGMGIPAARTAGVGLSSMRERAAELGGTLALETAMGGGTTVRATLPLGGGAHGRPD